ncbi:MAG: DUF5684 domain-containing protein [Candidatus Omnitrophota bacterium]
MKKILIIFCLCFLAASPSYAKSVVHLKGGEQVTGDIVERTDDYVRINFEGVELTYWSDQIEKIDEQKGQDILSQDVIDVSSQSSPEEKPTDVSTMQSVIEVIVPEASDESIETKSLVVDGSADDWAGALFVFDEVGELLPVSSDRFDVKKIYIAQDKTNLYFLITLKQDIVDYFAKSDNTGSYIAEIYLNTDNDAATGCSGIKLFRYGEISGYDCEITVSSGWKAASEGGKAFVSYSILFPTEKRDSFYLKDAGHKSVSLDKDSLIAFSGNTIELSVPLSVLNIRKGVEVEGFIVECAKMAGNRFVFIVKKEEGLAPLDTVKILVAEKLEQQERLQSSQESSLSFASIPSSDSLKVVVEDYEQKRGLKKVDLTFADMLRMSKYALIFYVYFALCLQIIAIRTGVALSWLAWIPIGNFILMCRITSKPLWWIVLLFVPLVNIFIFVLFWAAIAEARGKPRWLGFFMFIPGVNFIIPAYLAFFK